MLLIFIRTIITFFILFALMRLMGKRQIGEMQPFEFVITLLIAELACIPMADVSIPLTYGIISICSLFILHQFFAFICKKSHLVNRIISSKPSVVIDSDGINFGELKKLNIGIDELQENLRNAGYSNFDEIEYALIETNGQFSILKKQDKKSDDENYKTPLSVCVVEEGKFLEWEIKRLNLDKDFIIRTLKTQGVDDIKNVLVVTIDNNGKFYFQQKNSKYKTIDTNYKGAHW